MNTPVNFNSKLYDPRHGGPFDRGSSDSWYSRDVNPHYFIGGTYETEPLGKSFMSAEQIEAYMAGYNWNEEFGGKKEW